MKKKERTEAIISALREAQTLSVQALSERFGVSVITIRKDLQQLESEGLVIRTFGGVTLGTNGDETYQSAYNRQRIADRILEEIHEGDCIILNAGETTRLIARGLLHFQRLRIITNSVYVTKELSEKKGFQVIFLGGEMNASAVFTFGPDAAAQLEQYRADMLIISPSGLSHERGLTTRHPEAADLLRMMTLRANRIIIAADERKIGYESFYHVCDTSKISMLVTNTPASSHAQQELSELQKSGIHIVLC